MSNNKQSMKLYTKKDFLKAAEFCEVSMSDAKYIILRIDEVTDPIELPSDEEIQQYVKSLRYTKHLLDDGQYNDGKIVGAELAIQWFRNKIQGGNNEH